MKLLKMARAIGALLASPAGEGKGREFDLDVVRGPVSQRGGVKLPVLFPLGGINNLERNHPLAMYGQASPWVWHTFFEDFDKYVAGDWTITVTEAGASSASEALADVDGGVLLLTNDLNDLDRIFYQKKGSSFLFEAGKPMLFGARWKVSEVIQVAVVVGLQNTDTTPLAVTDGIWFGTDDGDAFLDFHAAKASVQADATAFATLVADTWVTTEFAYDGEGNIWYALNGVVKGKISTAANFSAAQLTLSFGVQNGEALSKTMSIDYLFAAKYHGATR